MPSLTVAVAVALVPTTFMYAYDVRWPPGEHYLYGSLNMQLLWDVLHRRLRGDTVSHYFEGALWGPLGLLFGVPITAALKVACDRSKNRSLQAWGAWLGAR